MDAQRTSSSQRDAHVCFAFRAVRQAWAHFVRAPREVARFTQRHAQSTGRTKPIERVTAGDRVWAWDPAKETTAPCAVKRLYRHEKRLVIKVLLETDSGERQLVEATTEHPFWVQRRGGWMPRLS